MRPAEDSERVADADGDDLRGRMSAGVVHQMLIGTASSVAPAASGETKRRSAAAMVAPMLPNDEAPAWITVTTGSALVPVPLHRGCSVRPAPSLPYPTVTGIGYRLSPLPSCRR